MKMVSFGNELYFRSCVRLTIIIISITISSYVSTRDTLPEVEHYAADWEYEDFRISPDGQALAYINRRNGEDNVVVLNLNDMSVKAGFNSPDANVVRLSFLTNDHLIIGVTDYRRTRVGRDKFIFNIKKNKKIKLNWGSHVSANSTSIGWINDLLRGNIPIYGVDENTGKIAIGQFDKYRSMALYLADLETGQSTLLERGTKQTRSWVVGKGNKPLIRVDVDRDNNKRKFFLKKEKWQLLLTTDNIWDSEKSLSEDQEKLYIIDTLDFSSVLSVSLADGSTKVSPFSRKDRDVGDFINNRNNQILGVVYDGLRPETRFIDGKINSAFQRLSNSFPLSSVRHVSGEDSLEKIIVSISGEDSAFGYYLFNTSTLSLTRLKSALPKIKNMAKREMITYESSDGTLIPAILRLPLNTDSLVNMPLIVIPKNFGEISTIEWQRDADFFSAKGYAVFSPNYRSSYGFGLELRDAAVGLHNNLILQDIDDGIELLSKRYSLDMNNIHVFGYGFGGYLALMSAANYPSRYRSVAAVDPYWYDIGEGLEPIRHASQSKADFLLISDKNYRWHNQVKNIRKHLKSKSKDVSLKTFKTKHGNRNMEVREKILQEIDSFLER
jgi:dipeptidyl aminopeptidase/acylaminoacyl peptidase